MAAARLPLFRDVIFRRAQCCLNFFPCRYQSDQIEPIQVDEPSTEITLDPFSQVKQSHKMYLEDLKPPLKRSFNLAAYVNQSRTLQELVKLGVSLYDIENTNRQAASYLMKLDFEKDCVQYIKFLVDNGLKPKNLGRFISEYPAIFQQHLDDLQTRIDYLEWKRFSKEMIAKALNRSSTIIYYKTKTTDYKLGELQIEFGLSAELVREIIVKHPLVIAIPVEQYKLTNFTLEEEFGFLNHEIHMILGIKPEILEIPRPILIDRLDLLHNTMELKHSVIAKFPKLITSPIIETSHRFEYLKALKRNQFNPLEPLFVPPTALYSVSDETFCSKYAKTTMEDYKLFLRTR